MKILDKNYFERPVLEVASDLLGKVLCMKKDGEVVREVITEVEAYDGPNDLASHASKGKTNRTKPMFEEAGTIYIYLVYGMYWMFNIVTGEKDYPAAILIRGTKNHKGPGVLTRELGVDKKFNEKRLGKKTGIWIEESREKVFGKIKQTPRIGVLYAGDWKDKPYRFVLED